MSFAPLTRRGFAVSAGRAAAAFALLMAEPWRLTGLLDEATAATSAVGFADADYWAFIDPIVEHMDRLWLDRDACYVINGAGETVINAALCTIHAVAAMSGHDGPLAQRPARRHALAPALRPDAVERPPDADRARQDVPPAGLDREHARPGGDVRQVDRPEGGRGARGRVAGPEDPAGARIAGAPDGLARERLATARSSATPASA